MLNWIFVFSILLCITYLLRFIQSLNQLPVSLPIPDWYLPVTGLLWGTVWLAFAAGLWIRKAWVTLALRVSAAAYVLWLWIEQIFLTRSSFAERTIPFVIVIPALLYTGLWFVLRSRKVRDYFKRRWQNDSSLM